MSKKQEEMGSFGEPEQESPKKQSPPPTDASAPLFKLMGEIRDAIKENTEALNSLLTTFVAKEGKPVEVGHTMEKQAGVQAIKPVMPPNVVPQPFNPPLPEPTPETVQPSNKVEEVKMLFPEDLENLLAFTDEGDYVKVKPRQWLGSDNFAKVAAVIREVGGEYKSAGKESHFRIPK